MRILWFTNSASNANKEFGFKDYGGAWISELESLLVKSKLYNLGICFFYYGESYKKFKKDNVNYYGIPFMNSNRVNRILRRYFFKLDDEDPDLIHHIIDEFKPDIIQVFGIELGYGKILMNKFDKVLFHLQGLPTPIISAFIPPGINSIRLFLFNDILSILKGKTFYHKYRILKKWARREQDIIRYWKYFAGRTDWDRNYIELNNSNAIYFHCDEVLRESFFLNKWEPPISDTTISDPIIIGTTINANTYKGLNLIYDVLAVIKNHTIIWKVFGINKEDTINRLFKRTLNRYNNKSNIEFFGQISADDLISHLKTCHLFVHPSYIDNSSNSVCEAMSLGMPVLSSSVGGIRSLIIDKETGFFFNPYDKYDLAGLLVHLINNYNDAIQAGIKAREIAIKRHSPETILKELLKIYNFILDDI